MVPGAYRSSRRSAFLADYRIHSFGRAWTYRNHITRYIDLEMGDDLSKMKAQSEIRSFEFASYAVNCLHHLGGDRPVKIEMNGLNPNQPHPAA